MKLSIVCTSLLALGLGVTPAVAQNDVYDNGPINGTIDAFSINFGNAASDQFTLTSNSTINGLDFGAWLFPGDVLQTAEVSITSSEFGGTTYFDQTVSFSTGRCFDNPLGFQVCEESSTFSGPSLNAGNYWLNLQNAVVSTGNPVFWDQNDGPSLASSSFEGTIPSESFTILGSSSSGTGTTPEPSSVLLFGSGIVGALGVLRRKFSA